MTNPCVIPTIPNDGDDEWEKQVSFHILFTLRSILTIRISGS